MILKSSIVVEDFTVFNYRTQRLQKVVKLPDRE